jgi:Cysteine-rich CPXCG
MIRRRSTAPASSVRCIDSPALDDKAIEQQYGLEPLIEVGGDTELEATQFVVVACPYCAESFETQVDLSGGSFNYIEDCQVCCQPIDLGVEVSANGELLLVTPRRLDT